MDRCAIRSASGKNYFPLKKYRIIFPNNYTVFGSFKYHSNKRVIIILL